MPAFTNCITSFSICFLIKLHSCSSSKLATIFTASSTNSIKLGKVSRNNPLIRNVTSILGRPNSSNEITSNPITLSVSPNHTGRIPYKYKISAISSPLVLIVSPEYNNSNVFGNFSYFCLMRF